MEQSSTANASRSSLVPIPRNGLRGSSGILLFLMLTLSLCTVGVGLSQGFLTSPNALMIAEVALGAALVALFLYTWRIASRAKGVLPLLLLVAVFLAFATGSVAPAAVLLAFVFAITLGALTLSIISKKQAAWLPLAPVVAYTVTLLVCRDAIMAAACLLPVPAALALSVGTRRSAERDHGPTRVGVICLTALAMLVSIAAFVAAMLYRLLGSLDFDTLSAALETAREAWIEQVTAAATAAEISEEMLGLSPSEYAAYLVNYAINCLLGVVIAAVNVLVAVSQLLLHASLVSFGCGDSLSDRVRIFRMSAVSCVVFTAAFLLSLIGSGESSTLWGTVAENVSIALSPGLAFAGMLRLVAGITSLRPGCLSMLALMLAPLLFLIAQPVLAAVEVFGRLFAFISSKLRPPEDDGFTGTPPDNL